MIGHQTNSPGHQIQNKPKRIPSTQFQSRDRATLVLTPAEAKLQRIDLPQLDFMTPFPTLAGRKENIVDIGEKLLSQSGRPGILARGGSVEKERKASEEAPSG